MPANLVTPHCSVIDNFHFIICILSFIDKMCYLWDSSEYTELRIGTDRTTLQFKCRWWPCHGGLEHSLVSGRGARAHCKVVCGLCGPVLGRMTALVADSSGVTVSGQHTHTIVSIYTHQPLKGQH